MSSRCNFLELKAKLGTLTEAEHAELDRIKADRSYTYINNYGVLVSTVRDYTLEEWKAHRDKVNAESQARHRQLLEENKGKTTGGAS